MVDADEHLAAHLGGRLRHEIEGSSDAPSVEFSTGTTPKSTAPDSTAR